VLVSAGSTIGRLRRVADITIRGMVRLIQVEIRDTHDLQPDRAAELLNKLTALLGNLNDEIRDRGCRVCRGAVTAFGL
jgi:uncharacterized protein (DUF1501 family)